MNRKHWICFGLILLTLTAYLPVINSSFINYDDPPYVTRNPYVQAGLTRSGIAWAFTAIHANNWHPLTWMSHMLDCAIFGPGPKGPHVVNLLFHLANILLLFGLLQRATQSLWRSAIVAALFAWHPTHVESVAWISERKDVLSGFFWLLSIYFYVYYAERSKTRGKKTPLFYGLALLCFVLGLLSKPMVVTLPFVLLILDFWPLARTAPVATDSATVQKSPHVPVSWARLVLEKLPFFVLAGAGSVATFIVQKKSGAIYPLDHLPVGLRVSNAVVSYVRYIGKLFWPENLYLPYALPDSWAAWKIIAAAGLLVFITLGCLFLARREPPLIAGWLWFLGTLVPVIGLVQVGMQAMADRYMYLPSIGFFIAAVWGASALVSQWPKCKTPLTILAVAFLAACLCWTFRQAGYWKDSATLFEHTQKLDRNNFRACYNLGEALLARGNIDSGMLNLFRAAELNPNYADVQARIGQAFADQGRLDQALAYYHRALELNPDQPEVLNNLAWILATSRDDRIRNGPEAVQRAERACAVTHNQVPVMLGTLAAAYAEAGRFKDAIETGNKAYQLALALNEKPVAEANQKLLELYRANRPYRQAPPENK